MTKNKTILKSLTLYLCEKYEFQRETDIISEYLRVILETINSKNNIKFDYFTFYQITEFPLFPSKKIFDTLMNKYCKEISPIQNFINIFNKLYTSSLIDMTDILFNILDFDNDNIILLEDVKLFFIYFHFVNFDSKTENNLYLLIDNFFNGQEKLNKEDFIWKTLNKNSDILTLFYFFLQEYCFYNENILNCFKNFRQFKRDKNFIRPKKIEFENLIFSLKAREYIISLIKNNEKDLSEEVEEDDNELQELLIFEKDFNIIRGGLNKDAKINILEYSTQFTQLKQFEYYEHLNLTCFTYDHLSIGKRKRLRLHLLNKNLFIIKEDLDKFPFFQLEKIIYLSSLCSFINIYDENNDFSSSQCYITKYYLEIETLFNNIKNTFSIYLYNKKKFDNFVKLIKNNIGKNYNSIYDDFEIINDLGEGKFGVVKLGLVKKENLDSLKINDRVAIKIVNKDDKKYYGYFEANQWEQFLCKTLQKINCQYLIRLYSIYEDQSYIYYIYEYIRDHDLKNFIISHFENNYNIFEITKQILIGLNNLHKYGIVHRDIKPQNILFDREKKKIKITDFGLSTIIGKSEHSTQSYGSLYFKSPELLKGKYNYKTDIWSFGITLFYIVFKGPPFKDSDKKNLVEIIKNSNYKIDKNQIINNINPDNYNTIDPLLMYFFDDIITLCLSNNPDERINDNELYDKFIHFSFKKKE